MKKRNIFILALTMLSATTTNQVAAATDFGDSRIVSQDSENRPQILVDGNEDPYLYTLSKWYGITVQDCEEVNPNGYKHDMLYTLPITVEKYCVPAGIGIYRIAENFGVSQEALQHLNNLEDISKIKEGQILYIPKLNESEVESQIPEDPTTEEPTIEPPKTEANSSNNAGTTDNTSKYQIKKGDTLSKISAKYATTNSTLLNLNPWIKDPNQIGIGNWLVLPNGQADNEGTESAKAYHIVAKGECLGKIATMYKITVSELLHMNPEITNPNLIKVGDCIKLKAVNSGMEFSAEWDSAIENLKKKYPTMRIGVGLYTPEGSYTYNASELITGCCTIKATYALYVIREAVENDIDIYTEKLTYQSWHYNSGSGNIKNQAVGTQYTIYELLQKLITISDNTAYNILLSKFTLEDFYAYNRSIGGQSDGCRYGYASVEQRYAEWSKIIEYIQSDSKYADVLYKILDDAQYGYIEQGMVNHQHKVLHKSGWCSGSYTGAGDVAFIDDQYLLIVMTDDRKTRTPRTDVVRAIGLLFDKYF
ncbi:MAG: LysM peptidoglycan-binding domain-containing protein [Clostridia bacterium]|nr:LysM peptidoglycan-binding domain-containing protein [Clostridia bacterium]